MTKPIPLCLYPDLDSTSSKAQELCQSGKAVPFAVQALSQTNGRGQNTRTWVSPLGNLYLTLALAPPSDPQMLARLPLKVALIVASFLEQRYAFRPTLKWPNDLLFGGAKLGGILCETSSQGLKLGPVFVGIGININQSPKISGDQTQESISIADIIHLKDIDVKELAIALIDALSALSSDADPSDFDLKAYQRFALEEGQFLSCSADQRLSLLKGYTQDGAVSLSDSIHPDQIKVLRSASTSWRWLYQDPQAALVVCDIGNSSVKVHAYRHNRDKVPALSLRAHYEELAAAAEQLFNLLNSWGHKAPYPIHIGSVSPKGMNEWAKALDDVGLKATMIPKRPVRAVRSQYNLNDLGIDRLALLEAVLAEGPLRCPWLLVSCGTATTIDALTPEFGHLGGMIFPGIALQLESLHQATGLLPLISGERLKQLWQTMIPHAPCGRQTTEAMVAAVLWSLRSSLETMKRWVQSESRSLPQIRITGGLGPLLADALGHHYESDLVLKGLKHMVLGGSR